MSSYYAHRCRTCRHLEHWHTTAGCSGGVCRCSTGAANVDRDPELVPTFTPHGRRVDTITEPGAVVFYAADRACSCDACVAAWGSR